MPALLSVNVNAIAQLRNRRDLPWPSVVDMSRMALQAGAQGITVHPRPDQRHIRFSDIPELKHLIDSEFPEAEFNIEGYPTDDFIQLVLQHSPDQVTLVPDDPSQATSDHGWDFKTHLALLQKTIKQFPTESMRVALFADADPEQMSIAADTGCHRVELYTGPYAACYNNDAEAAKELEKLTATANAAHQLGLQCNAGHDLTRSNLPPLVQRIPALAEVSIGHAITADALEFGMARTVELYLQALLPRES